jgi:hypothetical protein
MDGERKTRQVRRFQRERIADPSDSEGRMIDTVHPTKRYKDREETKGAQKGGNQVSSPSGGSVGVEFDGVVSGIEIALRDRTSYSRPLSSLTLNESW